MFRATRSRVMLRGVEVMAMLCLWWQLLCQRSTRQRMDCIVAAAMSHVGVVQPAGTSNPRTWRAEREESGVAQAVKPARTCACPGHVHMAWVRVLAAQLQRVQMLGLFRIHALWSACARHVEIQTRVRVRD